MVTTVDRENDKVRPSDGRIQKSLAVLKTTIVMAEGHQAMLSPSTYAGSGARSSTNTQQAFSGQHGFVGARARLPWDLGGLLLRTRHRSVDSTPA